MLLPKNEKRETRDEKRSFHVSGFSFLVLLMMALRAPAQAASHAVTPTGSGSKTGIDWNNAMAGLPVTLICGDVYYLADGTYANYSYSQNCPAASPAEIRKAQSYDYGGMAGWNTATMGSSQARWSRSSGGISFTIDGSYLVINGNGRQTTPGCGMGVGATPSSPPGTPSDCGIFSDASSCTGIGDGDFCGRAFRFMTNANNITIKYVEMAGNGNNDEDATETDRYGGVNHLAWQHIYGHNAGCEYMTWQGSYENTGFSYFWYIATAADNYCHPEYNTVNNGASYGVEHDNVYRDINGTANWAWLCGTCGTSIGWQFYNNVVFDTPGHPYSTSGLDDGVLWCGNGNVCQNFTFVQNTMANLCGNNSGIYTEPNPGPSNMTIRNNLWYGITGMGCPGSGPVSIGLTGAATYTNDHNSFIQTTASCPSGAGNVCDASGPNPFVSLATGNLSLVGQNSDWNNAANLGAPYVIDQAGNAWPADSTRDRGAFQAGGTHPVCLNACDINCDDADNVGDVQVEINMALGKVTCTNPSGTCNVTSVQKVINAALGGTCVAP